MSRFLRLALLLSLVYALAGSAIAIGLFRDADLRYRSLAAIFLVPAFQSLILLWVRRDPAGQSMWAALRSLRVAPMAAVFVFDFTLIGICLARAPRSSVVVVLFGVHAFAAAALMAWASRAVARRQQWMLLLLALGLVLYGLSAFWDWLALLPALLGKSAKVLRWAAVYVPLFVAALCALLVAAKAIKRYHRASGWLELAAAALLVSASVIASNVFFRPYLIPPWTTIERICSYGTVTAMMLAALALRSEHGRDAEQ
jgi:hypothetical protein